MLSRDIIHFTLVTLHLAFELPSSPPIRSDSGLKSACTPSPLPPLGSDCHLSLFLSRVAPYFLHTAVFRVLPLRSILTPCILLPQERVKFVELDATKPDWPVDDSAFDVVLMSYISGSVPEPIIQALYTNAHKALKPGGRLLVRRLLSSTSITLTNT